MTKLAPSILSADFTRLGEQIRAAEAAGADYLHIDVMDGHFVPNISIGPLVVEACRRVTELPLDVHLMIDRPERFLRDFADAGADIITVHAEATIHLHRTLRGIRELGVRAGLAVNPLSRLDVYLDALPLLDLALIMSVDPGFGGQSFIDSSLARLGTVREWRNELNPECIIEVDGGINTLTAPMAASAGADLLVAGSAIFNGSGTVQQNIEALRASVRLTN
jgi:ribulose-phosphate 3-epimerase